MVFQEVRLAIELVAAVMSGDVGAWSMCGSLVGVSVIRMTLVEFCMRLDISVPLWSSWLEYHVGECAFISPVSMCGVSVSR